MQPSCSLSPMVIRRDDHQPCGGGKQAGLQPLPRPQFQGCSSSVLRGRVRRVGACLRMGRRPASSSSIRGRRASSSSAEEASSNHAGEGELLLPGQGAAVRPPPERRSCRARVAAVTGLAEGANFDNAGPVGRKRRQLQRAWQAGSAGSGAAFDAASCHLVRAWLSVLRTGDCRATRRSGMSVALLAPPTAPGDRIRRRTPRGRRSCSWIVLSSLQHDASARRLAPARLRGLEWGSAGAGWGATIRWRGAGAQVAAVVGAKVVVAIGGCLHRRDRGATCGRTSGSLASMACPRPSCGDVGEGPFTAAFALRSSLLLFSRPRRRSLSLPVERSLASHLEFVIPQALWCGGCSYPREWNRSFVCNGTLSMGVCSF
jgi:hypothetical protein